MLVDKPVGVVRLSNKYCQVPEYFATKHSTFYVASRTKHKLLFYSPNMTLHPAIPMIESGYQYREISCVDFILSHFKIVNIFITYLSEIHFNCILHISVHRRRDHLVSSLPTTSFHAFLVCSIRTVTLLRLISSSNSEAPMCGAFPLSPPTTTTTTYGARGT